MQTINMIMSFFFLLRQGTQKNIACPGSLYKNNKNKTYIHWFDVSCSKDALFTGCIQSDRNSVCFRNKSLSYLGVTSILRHPV